MASRASWHSWPSRRSICSNRSRNAFTSSPSSRSHWSRVASLAFKTLQSWETRKTAFALLAFWPVLDDQQSFVALEPFQSFKSILPRNSRESNKSLKSRFSFLPFGSSCSRPTRKTMSTCNRLNLKSWSCEKEKSLFYLDNHFCHRFQSPLAGPFRHQDKSCSHRQTVPGHLSGHQTRPFLACQVVQDSPFGHLLQVGQ